MCEGPPAIPGPHSVGRDVVSSLKETQIAFCYMESQSVFLMERKSYLSRGSLGEAGQEWPVFLRLGGG